MRDGVFLAKLGQDLLHVFRQPVPDILVDAEASGHLRTDAHKRDIGGDFIMLVRKCTGDDHYHAVGNAGLHLVVVSRQGTVHRDGTQMLQPVRGRSGRKNLPAFQVFQGVDREIGQQMVSLNAACAKKDNVLVFPRVFQFRDLAVKLVHDLQGGDKVVRYERSEISHVLERHLRAFPERANPAGVRQAVANCLKRVLEAVKCAAIGFRPLDTIFRSHFLKAFVGFSDHEG